MKSNLLVQNALRTSTAVSAVPKLVAEFNQNRYALPKAENSPLESIAARDSDLMPIASIIGPLRPRKGCLKASVDDVDILKPYNPVPTPYRFHIADEHDYYKYWSSPTQSAATSPYALPSNANSLYSSDCNPQVTYATKVQANKIVIGIENSLASPTNYEIYVQNVVAGAWVKVADQSNTTIDADGRIILYWQSASWGTTKILDYNTKIAGVQLRVTTMSKPLQFFQLIEIAACLEKDLSPWIQEADSTLDMGDTNAILPIGKISANVASINLFNGLVDETNFTKGLLFNNDNPNSIYYGILKENVKFTLDYVYDINNSVPVREFVMYAEQDWSADLEDSVQVSVRDAAKYLQEISAPETFYQIEGLLSVAEIVWRLLDAVGFVDYNIDLSDVTGPFSMDFFWCVGTDKVWDVLNTLAEGTQTAIYFDSYGILQVKTKEQAFKQSATPVWHVRGEDSVLEQADLISSTLQRKEIGNSVKVSYKPTDFKRNSNDSFVNELMWEPEVSPVILRSSDLQEDLLVGATYLKILAIEAQDWPYKGFVQVEGELIAYSGKEFTYVDNTAGGITKTVIISSLEEYQNFYYKTNTSSQYLDRFTGRLKISQRGVWNTSEKFHSVKGYAYQVYRFVNGTTKKTTGAFTYYGTQSVTINSLTTTERNRGYVRLCTTTSYDGNDWAHASYDGSSSGSAPRYYGIRFRYRTAGQQNHLGGIMISGNQTTGSGYFIEFKPGTNATSSKRTVTVYSKNTAGVVTQQAGKGFYAPFVQDKWYNLDVQFSNGGTNHYMWLWLDGRYLGKVTISTDQRTNSDCFGMFVRASSCYEFDYLYAFDRFDTNIDAARWGEDVSKYDRITNGYVSTQGVDEFTNDFREARHKGSSTLYQQRYNTRFFDEFGPVVHEMRKFEVKFSDKLPGDKVTFLATNQATAKYLDLYTTPFGVKFYAINVSHNDTEIFGDNEKMGVYCQNIVQGEEKSKTFEDADSIRISGKKELDFTSDWIQSDGAATNLGTWITSHWDNKTDEISVVLFGNPLLELTDTVYLTDPQQNKVSQKYFIIAIQNNFAAGIETTLRLRKVRV